MTPCFFLWIVIVVYFSRTGEQYTVGVIDKRYVQTAQSLVVWPFVEMTVKTNRIVCEVR